MPNIYYDSEGNGYTEIEIRKKFTEAKNGCLRKYMCEAYGFPRMAHDPDHTISRSRCKELKKTELIWTPSNWVWSSREAHLEWESYKNGKFSFHRNAHSRMMYTAIFDKEKFKKRFYCITNTELRDKLQDLFDRIDDEDVF